MNRYAILFPLCVAITLMSGGTTSADVRIRVSFNFITNMSGARVPKPGGPRGFYNDADITREVNAANVLLAATGRGYRLSLVSIADVPNYTDTAFVDNGTPPATPPNPNGNAFLISPSGGNARQIEDHARQPNSNYNWRSNAINFYVVQDAAGGFAGYCSFPGDNRSTILVASGGDGRGSGQLILHEIGHFFDLSHTFASCVCCDRKTTPSCAHTFGDDGGIVDTLPDFYCADATGANQSATLAEIVANGNAMGLLSSNAYSSLTPAERFRVDRTFSNLMSYRSPASLITDDQMDRWSATANVQRLVSVTGETVFTSTTGNNANDNLTALTPVRTVTEAHSRVSNPDDIILLRGGNYNDRFRIDKPCTLRATRGVVTIGQ